MAMTEVVSLEIAEYRTRAVVQSRLAVETLATMGVSVLITGSLARGRFGLHSDVDFLITRCPRNLKYAIEGIIEDIMEEIPFDTIYIDDLSTSKRRYFFDGALTAVGLG